MAMGKGAMHRAGRCIRDSENGSGRLGDEQREQTEAFGERHGQDGLDEDLAGSAGVAADGFASAEADEADALSQDDAGDEAASTHLEPDNNEEDIAADGEVRSH